VYLVGPEGGPLAVVDPGSPYPDQQARLEQVLSDQEVVMVLLTHHHGDHAGGAAALAASKGVPIAAHEKTARRLAGRVTVARELADGEVVHGLTCVHTPGHADGHLCFATEQAVIAGDMVAGIGWILVDPDEGDMIDYLASLQRLLERPPATLLPAHGPAIADGPAKLREYIAHRLMREAKVVAALEAHPDVTPAELLPEAYSDTPRPLWALAERALRAHLAKLAREGRALTDGRWRLAPKSL
jgi:glyoxylase-like metal-dependent hydrolase (beta-lactamase superfamily II)